MEEAILSGQSETIEDYPTDPRGHSCLILESLTKPLSCHPERSEGSRFSCNPEILRCAAAHEQIRRAHSARYFAAKRIESNYG
jgi:hypothetical protein